MFCFFLNEEGNLDEKHSEENCFIQKFSSSEENDVFAFLLLPPMLLVISESPPCSPPGASVWLRRKVPQHTRSSGLTDLLPVLTFLVREQRNDSKTEALAGRLQIIRVPPCTCSRPLWRSLWANGGGSLLWLLHRAAFFSPPFFSFSVRSLPSLFCSISSGASVCDQIPDKTNEIPLSLRCSLWLRLV